RKELPDDVQNDPAAEVPFTLWNQYLGMIIFPDHKTTQQQRSHISYTLKLVVESLLIHARQEDVPRFLSGLLRYYDTPEGKDYDPALSLLDAIRYLPPRYSGEDVRVRLLAFAARFAVSDELRLLTAALDFLREAQRSLPRSHP